VVRAEDFGTQRCGKYISAALNQHATTEAARIRIELSFGVGSCRRELRESPELEVGRIIEKK
jgi:hypothetical protein